MKRPPLLTETTAPCTLLSWDSEFFGVRIARLHATRLTEAELANALAWCDDHAVQCLYYLAPPDDAQSVQLAESAGFQLVDVRLDFVRKLDDVQSETDAALLTRPAKPADVPVLVSIADGSYAQTRFAYDSHFEPARVNALYREWITRSCTGYADEVLVAESANQPVGFVTLHLEDGAIGRIGLVGVHQDARGQGVAGALMEASFRYFKQQGCDRVTVATQARNIAAQRLYQSHGFLTREVGLWYHRWF